MGEILRNSDRLLSLLQLKPLLRQSLLNQTFTKFLFCHHMIITSPSSSGAPQSSTDHKLFKEWLVGEVLLEHVDVLEDSLDDRVHVPLPVVRQLHRHQH